MKATRLGIWMDHQHALLTEFTTEPMKTTIVHNEFSVQAKHHSLNEGESNMHTKEQHKLADYYKKLGETIRGYQEVILFGPTSAKNELLNGLKTDHRFEGVSIKIANADKMSEKELQSFVKKYF